VPFEAQGKPELLGAEGEEILGAFYGFLEAAEELLEVVAALDEVDFGGVDDEKISGGVAEKEVFVGAGDFLDVFEGDAVFFAGGFFGDAGAEDFRAGLEIDDQIGSGEVGGESFVIALVEFEFFVVEIDVGEDAVLFHEEIGENRGGGIVERGSQRFTEAALAFDEEVHLGAESGAGLGLVEVGEKGIVFTIENAAGVQALSEDTGESGFADTERAFYDDEAGRLRSPLRDASAFRGRGVVGGHAWRRPQSGQPAEIITERGKRLEQEEGTARLKSVEKSLDNGRETGRAVPGKRKDFHGNFKKKCWYLGFRGSRTVRLE